VEAAAAAAAAASYGDGRPSPAGLWHYSYYYNPITKETRWSADDFSLAVRIKTERPSVLAAGSKVVTTTIAGGPAAVISSSEGDKTIKRGERRGARAAAATALLSDHEWTLDEAGIETHDVIWLRNLVRKQQRGFLASSENQPFLPRQALDEHKARSN
jgi:hypothetical protein